MLRAALRLEHVHCTCRLFLAGMEINEINKQIKKNRKEKTYMIVNRCSHRLSLIKMIMKVRK
jgi:hypothetical protein